MKNKQAKETKGPETYMTGKMLVAMPAMSDSRFHRAVIYVCAHDEKGAMGLVVNKEMQGIEFPELLAQLDMEDKEAVTDPDEPPLPILSGGPVEMARGFLLHSTDFSQKETVRIDDDFSLTGTVSALKSVLKGKGPERILFALGYAGWSAGQLDQELKQNAWLAVEAEPDIIFAKDLDQKWNLAIERLGIDPRMLSSEGGRA